MGVYTYAKFLVLVITSKARFQNYAVELGSTSHLIGAYSCAEMSGTKMCA